MASQTSPKTPKSEAMDTPTPKAPSKSNQTRASSGSVRILEPVEITAFRHRHRLAKAASPRPAGLTPTPPVSRFGGESDASYNRGSFP